MFITYILYSKSIQRYYVGATSQAMSERLKKHNSDHKGFTGRSTDWEVMYTKILKTVSESRKLERKIKKRGALRYLDNLTDSE